MKFGNGYVILAVICVIGLIIPIDGGLRRKSRKFLKKRLRDSQIIEERILNTQATGSLQLSLDYCRTKAVIHKLPYAAPRCIKRWNHRYNKYCAKPKGHVTVKCKRLQKKVSELKRVWRNLSANYREIPSRHSFRCGRKLINGRKHGCCDGTSYKLKTHGCCDTQIYKEAEEGCCGFKVYSNETQDCCYGIVIFDIKKETCCARQVYSIDVPRKIVCCGNEPVDARYYFCNNGTALAKDSISNDSKQNTDAGNANYKGSKKYMLILWISFSASIILLVVESTALLIYRRVHKYLPMRGGSIDMSKSEKGTSSTTTVHHKRLNNYVPVLSSKRTRTEMGRVDSGESPSRKLIAKQNMSTADMDLENPSTSNVDSGPVTVVKKGGNEEFSEVPQTVDSDTQTADIKPVNILNSMGRPFDLQFVFNPNKKTLQIPDSSALLTLSDADTREETTCLASTFRSLPEIYRKLQLGKNECIASPAVEYHIIGKPLTTFAKVTLQFIGNSGRLKVLKVKSDHGSGQPAETKEIKRFDDSSREDDEEYYEITGPGLLAIHVMSMSWLVCTTCNQEHEPFNLEAVVYGRLDECPESPTQLQASVGSYIVDQIHLLPDYFQVMEDHEERQQRVQVLRRRLKLPPKVHMSDSIRISLLLDFPNGSWEHKMSPEGVLLQPEMEDIPLHSITGCHCGGRQNGLPFAKEWYLRSTNASNVHAGRLSCIINTALVSHSDGTVSVSDSHIPLTQIMYDDLCKRQNTRKNNCNVTVQAVPPSSHVQQPARDMDENEHLHGQPENSSQGGEIALLRPNRPEGTQVSHLYSRR